MRAEFHGNLTTCIFGAQSTATIYLERVDDGTALSHALCGAWRRVLVMRRVRAQKTTVGTLSKTSSGPLPVMYEPTSMPIEPNMARRPLFNSLVW